jgi:hypothetical protein
MYQVDAMDDADEFTEAANSFTLRLPGRGAEVHGKVTPAASRNSSDQVKSRLCWLKRSALPSDRKPCPTREGGLAAKAGERMAGGLQAAISRPRDSRHQRGIGKGGVKSVDEANLSLGRAYILTKNTAEAVKAFESVKSPEYAQLAQLWSIYAGQQ